MRVSVSWLRGTLAIAFACLASFAFAQDITAGDPGWLVRSIDSSGTIDNFDKASNVLAQGESIIDDSVWEFIDFNGGPWPDNNAWPIDLGDDFVVRAIADVTIPAGEWGVGWGSDDGGGMTIAGVEFVTSFENAREWNPADRPIIGSDTLHFDGNRGYQPSFGSFSLTEPLETTINTFMWERGGGDNFEVFYINLEDNLGITAAELTSGALDRPTPDNFWDLLGDPFAENGDWNVRVPDPARFPVAIPVSPGQTINGTGENFTKEEVGEVSAGLLHFWYGRQNPGSYEGVQAFYDFNGGPLEDPDISPFNPENTWWTGNQAALVGGTTEAPKYPAEIIDQARLDGTTFGDSDNSNYTTAVSGEIRFPADGTYTFTDGVDDLTVLAIDVNRDGEFGDDEFLINDNAWTSLNRDSNNGGFPNEYIPIEIDVPDDGNCDDVANASDECWYRIEAVFAEGGGTDAGILYWDENKDIEFPAENGDGRIIADADISELAIPEDHMRAPGGIVITGGNLAATLNGDFPYAFDVNEDGTFDSLTVNRSLDVLTTSLDLNGATIDLVANGDLSGLNGEFQILSADAITGDININVPDGVEVDTSRLATEGVLVFGMGGGGPVVGQPLPGDADGDGDVDFDDFVILSNTFNQAVDPPGSGADFSGNGVVDFDDFVALSNNFGATAGGAAVPEPSSLALLGIAGLLTGLLRRRRS